MTFSIGTFNKQQGTMDFVQQTIFDNPSISYRSNDTLDSAVVVMINNSYIPLSPYQWCKISYSNNNNDYFLLAQDNVEGFSKANGTYKHVIQLIEPTKILEKIFVPSMSLLGANYSSLYEELTHIIGNIHAIEEEYNFYIPNTTKTKLESSEAEDFTFSNLTLREMLDELFSVINCRVLIDEYSIWTSGSEEVLKYNIGFFDLNQITTANAPTNIIGVQSSNNIDTNGGCIVSNVSNAITPNHLIVKDTLKTTTSTATSSNVKIVLPYAIDYIKSFKFTLARTIQVPYETSSSFKDVDISMLEFDGSNYFVDKEYWDTLATGEQNKRIYYSRGSEEIDASRTYKGIIGSFANLDTMANEIIDTPSSKALIMQQARLQYPSVVSWLEDYFNPIVSNTYRNLIYTITYQPRISGLVMQLKDGEHLDTSIIDNQSANIVDLVRLGGNLKGKIQRLGNNELYVDVNVSNYTDILSVLSEITLDSQKYVIYQVDFSCVQDIETFYQVRYYMTKGYNNLNEKIGIKRERRIYAIPMVGYQTIVPKKKQIVISDTLVSAEVNEDSTLYKTFIRQLSDYTGINNNNVSNCIVSMTNGSANTFNLPVVCFGSGKSINMIAKFYDNYSAGMSVDYSANPISSLSWIGGKKVLYNPYVYANSFGNTDGEAFNFMTKWGGFTNRTSNGVKKQPLADSTDLNYFVNKLRSDNNTINFAWHKDASESIILQLIYFLMGKGNVIITDKLAIDNIFTSGANTKPLYVNVSSYPYKENATKIQSQSTISRGLIQNCFTFVEHDGYADIRLKDLQRQYRNIGIGDGDGNLYLAINGEFTSDSRIYIYEKN